MHAIIVVMALPPIESLVGSAHVMIAIVNLTLQQPGELRVTVRDVATGFGWFGH
jgi:hypothetical protein